MRLLSFKFTHLVIAALLALAVGGCSSTKIVDSWTAPDANSASGKRILLIALIKDPVTRRFFEEHFVQATKDKNIEIISSHEIKPHATDMDEKSETLEMLDSIHVDGVLVAQIQGVKKSYKHVPSRLDWYPDAFSSLYFYDYFYRSYRAIYRPGYIGSDNFFGMQFRYFSTKTEKLLWAGYTRTRNPRSVVKTIEDIANDVISALKSAGVI